MSANCAQNLQWLTVESCQLQQMELLISAMGQYLDLLHDTAATVASSWKVLPPGHARAMGNGPMMNLHASVSILIGTASSQCVGNSI